ncbi:SgcJ/EcaC family oxidoreductase [Saxibacter everestensis]|uniref:SgcJ/EcaC family oxidoreductase n=1 Tax=Saxibacter everestensis TaxID=2909229 RepID=A0ABY8QUT8_9MICO|nr:SgcJ/EcaC family oxidoreductase [Brevibacteriaceae bacterium ZFBP1038]
MQISIEQTLVRIEQAWNDGDARAYADLFTPDATYVIFAGSTSEGRNAIRRDHEPVLTKWQKGSKMRIAVKSVRHISDDVAIVLSEGGISKGKTIQLNKVQTFVFHRQSSGDWLCAAFQNTKKNKLLTWFASRGSSKAEPDTRGV